VMQEGLADRRWRGRQPEGKLAIALQEEAGQAR
jgi:hypothetical protein